MRSAARLGLEHTEVEVRKARERTRAINAEALGAARRRASSSGTRCSRRRSAAARSASSSPTSLRTSLATTPGRASRGSRCSRCPAPGCSRAPPTLRDPRAIPRAALALVLLQLAALPLANAVSRRYEAEADWVALRLTGDPESAEALFRRFARTNLSDPDPPWLLHALLGTHPTPAERVARARAAALRAGPGSRDGRVLRPGVRERVEQLLRELRRHVHPRHDDAGQVALLRLVVDARERERELVVREADVGEVRVRPGEVLGVDLDVELALGRSPRRRYDNAMDASASGGSRTRSRQSPSCSWRARSSSARPRPRLARRRLSHARARSRSPASRRPGRPRGDPLHRLLVLAGVALFAYVASVIVELIARGVLGDAYGHRRRRRAIDWLRDHTSSAATAASAGGWRPSCARAGWPSSSRREPDDSRRRRRTARSSCSATARGRESWSGRHPAARGLVASADSDVTTSSSRSRRRRSPGSCSSSRARPTTRERAAEAGRRRRVVQPYSSAGLRIWRT